MPRGYKKITYADRKNIEKLYKEGVQLKYIAFFTGVHISTIYRELKRCNGPYNADEAQKKVTR